MLGKLKDGASLNIRAHHLLCLLGFRGLGYSEEFITNMKKVAAAAFSENCLLKIVDYCDVICASCPYKNGDKCGKDEGSAERTIRRDREVASKLGIKIEIELPSHKLWELVAQRIDPDDLQEICKGCEWLNLGYCAEGIRNLKSRLKWR